MNKFVSFPLNVRRWAPKPFDRHDWVVDRCGKEVRYVIDYYGQQPSSADDNEAVMFVDARPAVDDFSSAMHRLRALWGEFNLFQQGQE
jgi:cytochrome c heme-lyase